MLVLAFSGERSGRLLNILQLTEQYPEAKKYLVPNVNSVEAEKFWLRLSYTVFINDLEMSVASSNKDALLLTLMSMLCWQRF